MASQAPARIVYRKLWEHDLRRYAAHLRRLEAEDRRDRFMGELDDKAIGSYIVGLDWHRTILIGGFVDGVLRGAAELHLGDHAHLDQAEVAFSVERACQNRGIASELMERILVAARNRGVRRLWLLCLVGNGRMRRVARKHGAAIQVEGAEATAELRPMPANLATLLAEAWDDGHVYAQKAAGMTMTLGGRLAARSAPWLALAQPRLASSPS
jgi:RimJ/RimL family protein N-acetyltransferase